jgi:hypothetical protein
MPVRFAAALQQDRQMPAKATNFNQLTVSLETYAFDSGIHFAPARNCKAAGVAAR